MVSIRIISYMGSAERFYSTTAITLLIKSTGKSRRDNSRKINYKDSVESSTFGAIAKLGIKLSELTTLSFSKI